jgi:hypothetical protein
MKTPTELTTEFIAEYKKWNDFAFGHKDDLDAQHQIHKGYDDLILKFCSSEKQYQGLAYGSSSTHCPKQELILEEHADLTKTIIKTRFTNEKFSFIKHDFEYHFVLNEQKWILEEVYLVDADGKYKCL